MREEFEAWYAAHNEIDRDGVYGISVFADKTKDGQYWSAALEDAWKAYQAGALAMRERAAKVPMLDVAYAEIGENDIGIPRYVAAHLSVKEGHRYIALTPIECAREEIRALPVEE